MIIYLRIVLLTIAYNLHWVWPGRNNKNIYDIIHYCLNTTVYMLIRFIIWSIILAMEAMYQDKKLLSQMRENKIIKNIVKMYLPHEQ